MRLPAYYSASTAGASTAFFCTLAMPFLQAASEAYTSEVAITSPLAAFKSNFTPVFVLRITN